MSEHLKNPNPQLKDDAPQLIAGEDLLEQSDLQSVVDLTGQIIADHYEILSVLGTGGLGTVYKANHKLLKKHVAIKFLKPGKHLDAKSVQRFQREAQAAIGLVHENIASVQEFGIHDDMPFIVMELANGKSLEQLLQGGYLEPSRALLILKQLLQALSYAHKHGVVHRDVKPSNIIVFTDDSGRDAVKLIDFGIAKIIENEKLAEITKTGSILGTPYYMSPEQCRSEPADHRTDIYSAACVAYEMLEGVPPFRGQTPISVFLQHINDPPMVLPAPPGLEGFERVIDKGLAKEPQNRYASAADILAELELLEAGKAPRHTFYMSKQKYQRGLIYSVLVLLVALCAVVSLVAVNRQEKSLAELSKEIREHPEVVENYIARAKLYFSHRNREAALDDINSAEKISPNNSEINQLKSSIQVDAGREKDESSVEERQ